MSARPPIMYRCRRSWSTVAPRIKGHDRVDVGEHGAGDGAGLGDQREVGNPGQRGTGQAGAQQAQPDRRRWCCRRQLSSGATSDSPSRPRRDRRGRKC